MCTAKVGVVPPNWRKGQRIPYFDLVAQELLDAADEDFECEPYVPAEVLTAWDRLAQVTVSKA
ncbi:MAG: hypothetical protein K8U57_18465 [Planctomycetes bacterium]|nr:hypothetical protein [Planctomycetota bacterium]